MLLNLFLEDLDSLSDLAFILEFVLDTETPAFKLGQLILKLSTLQEHVVKLVLAHRNFRIRIFPMFPKTLN